MSTSFENLTIGALATEAQINVETIRFYQRKGLMHEPNRPLGSVRRYGAADLGRVRFIKSAQRLGFSLDEISQLLKLEDGAHCDEARERAQHKLIDVRAKLAGRLCPRRTCSCPRNSPPFKRTANGHRPGRAGHADRLTGNGWA